jgi:glycosyltransferase involved in cell wall biosynthesis
VLFVLPSLIGGGAERIFVTLANNLDPERYLPIMGLGRRKGELLEQLNPGIAIMELGAERARHVIPALIKLVREQRPHTVITCLGMNFAAGAARGFFPKETRLILREGSSPTAFLNDISQQSRARGSLYRKFYRYLYRRADTVICQSRFMRDDIVGNLKVPGHKVKSIYNPVDFQRIDGLADELVPACESGTIRLVAVGRHSYEKGFDVLIKAFAIVSSSHPNVRLVLIGDGEDTSGLRALSFDLGLGEKVHFMGFQQNPYRFIKTGFLFVLPSRYEGFSNVLVEALACGVPVVATDCPSANREVLVEGVNGWFARSDDADSLAKAIQKAIRERGRVDPISIRADCENRFSVDRILPQYEREIDGFEGAGHKQRREL